MQIDLSGRTAFVSGSTQGIGRAIAARLAASGAAVVVNGRDEARVGAAVEELRAELPGADVRGIAADVATAAGADALFAELPGVDILVNNLGIFGPADLFDVDDETWQRYWDVNVMSAIRLTRRYAAGMRDRGWGRVQFMASDSAVVIPIEMVHYGVTKTALLGVSRGFAKALAGTGVTVNAVIAGPTHTEGVEEFVRELVGDDLPWDEAQAAVRARAPPAVAARPADRAGGDREPRRLPQLGRGVGDDRRRAARRRRLRRSHPPLRQAANPGAERRVMGCDNDPPEALMLTTLLTALTTHPPHGIIAILIGL